MISILIADDHPLILRGVEQSLKGQPDIRVVGRESDSSRILAAVEALLPNVLIQDLTMLGSMTGLDVIREVREKFADVRIIVLSMHSTLAAVSEAFSQGADAYVSKLGDLDDLVDAVRAVMDGERYLAGPFTQQEVDAYEKDMARRGVAAVGSLTKRELEVLGMVVRGHTSGEIADHLRIGRRTVESHRANLTSKLGVRNQVELVRYAIERGLVPGH